MANEKVVIKQGLTGGTSADLDSISYTAMVTDNVALVEDGSRSYTYVYDATSSAAESSPGVIKPDDAGANPGRWLLRPDFGLHGENLIANPSFIINQDGYSFGSSVAAGDYFLDHWFNDAGSTANTLTRVAVGTPSVDQEYYFSTTGASQVFGAMMTSQGGSIPIDFIAPGESLTISAKIAPGGSLSVYTGYANPSGSGSALTVSLAGTITSSDGSITFAADFGGWPSDQTPLAITLVGTTFKDVKVEKGGSSTEFRAKTMLEEMNIAEQYYRKTYDIADAPGTVTGNGPIVFQNDTSIGKSTFYSEAGWKFPRMSKTPDITHYSRWAGTKDKVSYWNGSSWVDGSINIGSGDFIGETGTSGISLAFTLGSLNACQYHMVADARF